MEVVLQAEKLWVEPKVPRIDGENHVSGYESSQHPPANPTSMGHVRSKVRFDLSGLAS